MSHLSARVGLLQISLAGVLWGTGGLGLQIIREHVAMSAATISAYRMLIAALVLLTVVVVVRAGHRIRSLVRARPGHVVLVGLSTAAYQWVCRGTGT